MGSRLRVWAAIALVVAAALAALPGTVTRIRGLVAGRPAPGDDLSVYDRRLRPVRDALLKAQTARIGYLPTSSVRATPGAVITDPHFLVTRYALAPTLLIPRATLPLVFADLSLEADPRAAVPDDFTIEQDFGDGLVLLRRKTP